VSVLASALVSLALLAQEENRLWFVEVEVRGPADRVVLDCGADGVTRAEGPFLAGEQRELRLPVPVKSPLGVDGLDALPLPRLEVEPPSAGDGRVLRWSAEQPAERVARLSAGLQPLVVAPASGTRPQAGLPELCVVALAGVVSWKLRARPALSLLLASAAAILAGWLASRRASPLTPVAVVLFDATRELALESRAARDEVALPVEGLGVEPPTAALELRVDASGRGVARSAGTLRAWRTLPRPSLSAGENAWRPLVETWVRAGAGDWDPRGPWPVGSPVPDVSVEGSDPPGWLAAVPVDGRGALLGRTADGEWVRGTGFGD